MFDRTAARRTSSRHSRAIRREAVTGAELGDEAFVTTVTQPGFPRPLRIYVVAWRHDNAVAVLTVNGVEGRVSEEEALALARKQQARIAAAAA